MSAVGGDRVTLPRVVAGEWIKLRSVRSNVVTLGAAAVVLVFFGAVFSLTADGEGVPRNPSGTLSDPVAISLGGADLAQLIVGVLGVLVAAGEYATGLIRTTFAAVGSRRTVLVGKVAAVGAAVAAVMAVATTVALVVGQALYAGDDPSVSLGDPNAARVIFGATAYLAGVAVIGVALGFVVRATAGAIGTLVGSLFILPNLLGLLPDGFADAVLPYFPSRAGASMMALAPGSDLLAVWPAFGVFTGWVVAALLAAMWLVSRRDA